ncbi:MAG: hypothetical protein JJU29_14985 [Verrucomicrobia bacterium]|nr:hypothetical protein [Verrucomicrobiota bacterium]MCH8513175.1 hypothetical protein [Kiritimatiellia bacterium]
MISLLISISIALAAIFSAIHLEFATFWVVLCGIGGYLAGTLLIGFIVRRRMSALQNEMQATMLVSQARIQRTIQQAQQNPGANPAVLQKQVELQQNKALTQALQELERLKPFQKWAITLGRQINTQRFQLLYQLKRFDEADEILALRHPLKKPIMMEPTLVAMKMARVYKRGDLEGMEKLFHKQVRWMRGDRGALLYGLMSWAWVKKGETEKAFQLLATAKEKTENETLARNWEHLANERIKKFSNAGLGDEWFALYLEAAPKPKIQRQRARRGGF